MMAGGEEGGSVGYRERGNRGERREKCESEEEGGRVRPGGMLGEGRGTGYSQGTRGEDFST